MGVTLFTSELDNLLLRCHVAVSLLIYSGRDADRGLMAPINYGIWGKPTATIDWCEENYVVTQFIAEFCMSFMKILPLFVSH